MRWGGRRERFGAQKRITVPLLKNVYKMSAHTPMVSVGWNVNIFQDFRDLSIF